MSLSLGMKAQIRSMVFVAGEPIPSFWPMRGFIHHNPLHGLEKLPFAQAVCKGERLFHGKGFLPRSMYQRYYREGEVSHDALVTGVKRFLDETPGPEGIDLHAMLLALLTEVESPITVHDNKLSARVIAKAIGSTGQLSKAMLEAETRPERLEKVLREDLLDEGTVYEALDALFGTDISEELDELVVKSCLSFFDEGQAVWSMPGRGDGLFSAWREVARRGFGLFRRGRYIRKTLDAASEPEGIIVHVLDQLGVPESQWVGYFSRELSRLHGWAGFIRWRSGARHYFHGQRFPGDLVDFLAIRLTLSAALIHERAANRYPSTMAALAEFVAERPLEAWLRQAFYRKTIHPAWAQRVQQVLLVGKHTQVHKLAREYIEYWVQRSAKNQADGVRRLASLAGAEKALQSLDDEGLLSLMKSLQSFEKSEGMLWLEAIEDGAIQRLMSCLNKPARRVPDESYKRPFAQALFCIDTRSERLRRHLESVGDYQTFGIAGFFGVPVSFMSLGKGNETHLCPVLLSPKNLVMEMSVNEVQDTTALSVFEKVVHELKESVFAPFVTVEAIGLLFGFDMVGKTLAPRAYNRWRSRLHDNQSHSHTHLLIDKLTREQADSIIRAVQRGVIAKAVEHEFEVPPESVTDDLIRELREVALGHSEKTPLLQQQLRLDDEQCSRFIERLRSTYRLSPADTRSQMERLGRIGFTLEEQVGFVSQALRSIGLTRNFSRFVLCVGHGSQSENNPYESALDCGACGGNPGLANARIFAHMANKPAVRTRLKAQGIDIPDDAWFVPAMHNTTTDEVTLYDLDLLPSTHPVYLDRLQNGLVAACRLCTQERMPELNFIAAQQASENADKQAVRNAMDWSQVRPEWGLARNAYFIIGRRELTEDCPLNGRAFLHSYDYRLDRKQRLLENIMTGPLVVGQWINMEHYFSAVDNEHYGSGSKVYHNVAGRFGVMTGNISDLRTGLPAQTVLAEGVPYHEPMRLVTVVEAPLAHVQSAIAQVAIIRRLLNNGWIRMMVIDPEAGRTHVYQAGDWQQVTPQAISDQSVHKEAMPV